MLVAMRTSALSFDLRRANNSTRCFRSSRTKLRKDWKLSAASGSARPVSVCRGCMSGWIRIPSTISTCGTRRDNRSLLHAGDQQDGKQRDGKADLEEEEADAKNQRQQDQRNQED